MTIPNTFTNGTTADADEVNANFVYASPVWDLVNPNGGTFTGIIAHSATLYSMYVYSSGDIVLWNGTTSTTKNTDFANYGFIRLCKADATHGVAIESVASGKVAFTDDSGTTWTTKTATGFGTDIYDVSFPTATLIVVAGNDAAGTDHVVFSTDDGGTWTDATTSPSAMIYAMDMFDGNTGYAIDNAGNIWKTTNAGVDWTDTTHNITGTVETHSVLFCISATVFVYVVDNALVYYDNGTGTSTIKWAGSANIQSMGFVNTNSYIYTVIRDHTQKTAHMFSSSDSGVNWAMIPMYYPTPTTAEGVLDALKCSFAAYDTGKIMFLDYTQFYKQDRSNL